MFKSLFPTLDKQQNQVQVDTRDLDMQNIPRHIAIIMDGNGRWAKAQGKVRTFGHAAGAETLKNIVRVADKLGVKVITAYAFSTENWKRSVQEVTFIMELIAKYLAKEIEEFNANNVQVRFIGDRTGLPAKLLEKLDNALSVTHNNTGIVLNLAINYGGQAEILQAVRALAEEVKAGRLESSAIDEQVMEDHLFTKGLPMPDLLIRPGGDKRISNFLLWQIAYAEIWYTDTYWPDFTGDTLVDAILAYQGRERRFGGVLDE